MKNYMGIDQYSTTYHNLGPHPRKTLLERLGRSHAEKMYRDGKDGEVFHVGYIVAGLWIELHEVLSEPFSRVINNNERGDENV